MKFRKKPVVIDAFNYAPDSDNNFAHPEWFQLDGISYPPCVTYIEIKTLEGTMIAWPGDWVIRGVKGEMYPCKPDIFVMTYEQFFAETKEEAERDRYRKALEEIRDTECSPFRIAREALEG